MESRLKTVALVIADISRYTNFIKFNKRSLLHATEIISELIEAVIDKADFPLVLNKLEGDATLLYSELGADKRKVVQDAVRQVQAFFGVFRAKAAEIADNRKSCSCDACQRITRLRLKAVLHCGEVAFKSIRQFEELTGENVILVHRLLKNTIPGHEYILMTESFYESTGGAPLAGGEIREETYDDLGSVKIRVFFPEKVTTNDENRAQFDLPVGRKP